MDNRPNYSTTTGTPQDTLGKARFYHKESEKSLDESMQKFTKTLNALADAEKECEEYVKGLPDYFTMNETQMDCNQMNVKRSVDSIIAIRHSDLPIHIQDASVFALECLIANSLPDAMDEDVTMTQGVKKDTEKEFYIYLKSIPVYIDEIVNVVGDNS